MRLPVVLAAAVAVVFLAPGLAGAAPASPTPSTAGADPSVAVAVRSAASVRAVTAAEAGATHFCLAWCAGTADLGHDIWGVASGGYGWQPI